MKVGAKGDDRNISDFARTKLKLSESYMVNHASNLELELRSYIHKDSLRERGSLQNHKTTKNKTHPSMRTNDRTNMPRRCPFGL